MKLAKALYFTICFSVMCIFFYFFCNSNKKNKDETVLKKNNGYEELVAYSEDSEINIAKCDVLPMSDTLDMIEDSDELWQPVQDTKVFLYSAYFDERKSRRQDLSHIRILGMSKGQIEENLYCQIWHDTANNSVTTSVITQMEIWVPSWDLANSSQYYRPYLFSCPVKEESSIVAVSVALDPCQNPSNIFRPRNPQPNNNVQNKKKDFVVCLKAMDFEDDLSFRLIEWIELQFLLGADKISAYVYRVHSNMMKVLEYYRDLGKFSIKSHVLPGDEPNEPHARTAHFKRNVWQKRRHEIITYNDCLYRHINTHNFAINLDLDEAIIPVISNDWSELLESIFSDHEMALHSYSSLSAPNVYFFDVFGEYDADDKIPEYMHMLRHVYRSANFTSPGFAVKSFHATNNSLAVFNHYTLFPLYSELRRNALIGRHLAQMHHYRATCPQLMEQECSTNYMKFFKKDVLLWKYKDNLVRNVLKTARHLKLLF